MSALERPNLFDFTMDDPSQVPMTCWLISWADARYASVDPDLHQCARGFVAALLRKHDVSLPEQADLQLLRPLDLGGTDRVLARVSPQHVLLIAWHVPGDYGPSPEHFDDDLIEPRNGIGHVSKESIYPIYLSAENTKPFATYRRAGRPRQEFRRPFKVFDRHDFLAVLRCYNGSHNAATDYRDYLERREAETESFRVWDLHHEQRPLAWEGFFRYLEERLGLTNVHWHDAHDYPPSGDPEHRPLPSLGWPSSGSGVRTPVGPSPIRFDGRQIRVVL